MKKIILLILISIKNDCMLIGYNAIKSLFGNKSKIEKPQLSENKDHIFKLILENIVKENKQEPKENSNNYFNNYLKAVENFKLNQNIQKNYQNIMNKQKTTNSNKFLEDYFQKEYSSFPTDITGLPQN